MSGRVRDCHYVPQTYQKQWLYDSRKLFYYSKESKQKICKSGNTTGLYNPQKQMFIRDYYHTTLENINFLETYFSNSFENNWTTNINSIKDTLENNKSTHKEFEISIDKFSIDSLNDILEFMAIQYFRIFENALPNINETIRSLGIDPSTISEDDKKEAWRGGLIDSSKTIGYAPKLLDFFKDLHISIYRSQGISFILSDSPVVHLLEESGEGESYIFPITPEICIEINNSSKGNIAVMNANDDDVKQINIFLYKNCDYVFGYNKNVIDIDDVIPPINE